MDVYNNFLRILYYYLGFFYFEILIIDKMIEKIKRNLLILKFFYLVIDK